MDEERFRFLTFTRDSVQQAIERQRHRTGGRRLAPSG
jgi:hypothetical protein